MYTIVAILLLLLIVVFSVLLYFKSKKDRQATLDSGSCPSCGATSKTFIDETTKTKFTINPIKSNILKSHGCSGILEIEYRCDSCGLKEIHTSVGQGCRL